MDEEKKSNCDTPVNGTDDREARLKFWVAAYTRPKSEKKASFELSKSGIETYVPIQKQLRTWSDRKKFVDVPVIPMIIFVKITTETEILTLNAHPLILKILCLPGEQSPAYIPDSQIEQLKFIIKESNYPLNFVTGLFKSSDIVRITRGPFTGIEGIVEKTQEGKTKIIVVIDFLGGAKIDIQETDIELIKQV